MSLPCDSPNQVQPILQFTKHSRGYDEQGDESDHRRNSPLHLLTGAVQHAGHGFGPGFPNQAFELTKQLDVQGLPIDDDCANRVAPVNRGARDKNV